MSITVGIDLVAVDEVRESLRAHGERYVNRIYTDAERSDCRSDPRCLATRFAAKEATAKALRVRAGALPWHSIGVVRDADGRPSIRLTGEAAALAEQRGMQALNLSLTLRRGLAMAVVVAQLHDSVSRPPGSPPSAV